MKPTSESLIGRELYVHVLAGIPKMQQLGNSEHSNISCHKDVHLL
jgi:hypothetical protein